jgi:uncharacterized protein
MRTVRFFCILCIAVFPFAAQAQSFDCRTAGRSDERAICDNQDLAELDIQMSNSYFRLLNSLGESARARLRSEQAEWLNERQERGSNQRCLRSKYQQRINELAKGGTAEPMPSPGPVLLESYVAFLSETDHFNSSGERLRSAAAIIRQDRANFHRFGRRDPQDENDRFFADEDNRAALEQMLERGRADPGVISRIVNGTVLIRVNIYRGGAGPYIVVTVMN